MIPRVMAANKSGKEKAKHFEELDRIRIGFVSVVKFKNVKSGANYFKTVCKRAVVPKSMQSRAHPSWKDAKDFANQLN